MQILLRYAKQIILFLESFDKSYVSQYISNFIIESNQVQTQQNQ